MTSIRAPLQAASRETFKGKSNTVGVILCTIPSYYFLLLIYQLLLTCMGPSNHCVNSSQHFNLGKLSEQEENLRCWNVTSHLQ